MAAYSIALNNVALAGPTLFSHVINTAAHIASHANDSHRKYYVVLIITVRTRVAQRNLLYFH